MNHLGPLYGEQSARDRIQERDEDGLGQAGSSEGREVIAFRYILKVGS